MSLHPWAEGPFELILHGEIHYRAGEDFDRRMALISFDNSIEVSITTYLSLNPILRGGVAFETEEVVRWSRNFHTKLDFFEYECNRRKISISVERTHVIWYHDLRNKQYHEGRPAAPNRRDLEGLRSAAISVFSVLFDVPDVEAVLDQQFEAMMRTDDKPRRDPVLDDAIVNAFGLVAFGDSVYLASELLHSHDAVAYKEIGLELLNSSNRLRTA